MSADPEAPADPRRISGGHIVRNMIYSHDQSNNLEIVSGWSDQGVREYNQETVRPADLGMSKRHPCIELNQELIQCSDSCPREMLLAGRTAVCNTQRQALMRCLVKNKQWREEAAEGKASWYHFW